MEHKITLFALAWKGMNYTDLVYKKTIPDLVERGFLSKDGSTITDEGVAALSPDARRATNRPRDYWNLSQRQQWNIDASLGILDWDGS